MLNNSFKIPITNLVKLRKEIHRYPETAGKEKQTAKRIITFAKKFNPSKIVQNIGGNGIAVIFEGKNEGPVIMIRCELDALPISETNKFKHRSTKENVSHKCGHDGHMTIVSALIPLLSKNKIKKGKVILLYQPAEETGEGAERILKDKKFGSIKPDYIFALHNLPGFKKKKIIVRKNEFAAASKGMIIKLKGKTSHAAEPGKGRNPAPAVAEIIQKLLAIPKTLKKLKDFSLITTIHVKVGERAFGTSAGHAEVMFTLRSFKNDDMKALTDVAIKKVKMISKKYNLGNKISFTEEFPATVNDSSCVEIVKNSAKENKLNIHINKIPFRWSEDFGHFTNHFKGALFGLGSGKKQPALHNPDYDFPDEIIESGTRVFYSIIKNILN